MKDIILTPIDKSDSDLDLIPIDDWIDYVNTGGFIDYDGHGRLATENDYSNLVVYPSYVNNNKITRVSIQFGESEKIEEEDIPQFAQFTHIIWYNR